MELRILIFILFCANKIESRPSKQLDSSTELAWEAWLLIHGDRLNLGDETLRKITPKSIFTVRPFSPELLPPCPEGYISDSMGRCNKFIKIEQNSHIAFLIDKLNSMYTHEEDDYSDDEEEEDENVGGGPLQFNIPIEQEKEIVPSSSKNETASVAIIVTSLNENTKANNSNTEINLNMTEPEIDNEAPSVNFISSLEKNSTKNITLSNNDTDILFDPFLIDNNSGIDYIMSDDIETSNISLVDNSSMVNISNKNENINKSVISHKLHTETVTENNTFTKTRTPQRNSTSPNNISTVIKFESLDMATNDKSDSLNNTKTDETLLILIPLANSSKENGLNTSQKDIIDLLKKVLPPTETKNNSTGTNNASSENNVENSTDMNVIKGMNKNSSVLANDSNIDEIKKDAFSIQNFPKHKINNSQNNYQYNNTYKNDLINGSEIENKTVAPNLNQSPAKNDTFELTLTDINSNITNFLNKIKEETTTNSFIDKNKTMHDVPKKELDVLKTDSKIFDKVNLSEIIEHSTENQRPSFNIPTESKNTFKIHHPISFPNDRHTSQSSSMPLQQNADNTQTIKYPEYNHRNRDKHISWWLQPDSRSDSNQYRSNVFRSQYFQPRRPFSPSIGYPSRQSQPLLYRDMISRDTRRYHGTHRWNNR